MFVNFRYYIACNKGMPLKCVALHKVCPHVRELKKTPNDDGLFRTFFLFSIQKNNREMLKVSNDTCKHVTVSWNRVLFWCANPVFPTWTCHTWFVMLTAHSAVPTEKWWTNLYCCLALISQCWTQIEDSHHVLTVAIPIQNMSLYRFNYHTI